MHVWAQEVLKDNNLGCKYGIESVRLLTCDWGKMLALASVTGADPATTTAVALVNDGIYGGVAVLSGGLTALYTGNWGSCDKLTKSEEALICQNGFTFADDSYPADTPSKFLNVLVHEVAHAQGGVSDEYASHTDESRQVGGCS